MSIKYSLLSTVVMAALSGSAMAAPTAPATNDTGLITFDGAVSAHTCTITTNNGVDASNVTITMPTVTKTDVEGTTIAAGGVGAKEFELVLSECTTVTGATIAFNSSQFAELSTGTLKPDPTVAGTADNVSLALYNNGNGKTDQVKIGRPDDAPQSVTIADGGTATFAYKASYVPSADWNKTSNPVKPGKVSSNATFTLTYK
ncbi:fimbrial protein [Hafnia alvei]|uniref:Fimbrial protein n=1 Tax=Hafnia alvei TaxID=569 RepID=A0ABD7Q6X6_HAFAL|nr:fimbrial protein [Hafnia alvei]TBL69510.1 fimbrial protein [Hafnia alvei]